MPQLIKRVFAKENKTGTLIGLHGFLLIGCMLLLSACGKPAAELGEKSHISLFEDGHLEASIVESFAEEYYQEQELLSMVEDEITIYNVKKGNECIKVQGHSLIDQVISLDLYFMNVEAYNDYMPETIFCGTLQEAYASGYDFNRSLCDSQNDIRTIGKNDLMNMGGARVVIFEGDAAIRLPDKIKYYSQGMTLIDDNTVVPEAADTYFIIY